MILRTLYDLPDLGASRIHIHALGPLEIADNGMVGDMEAGLFHEGQCMRDGRLG